MTDGPRFAIKAAIDDPDRACFAVEAIRTMYGGKAITVGDHAYLFASENEGGTGLFARGVVVAAALLPRRSDLARQTPRVTVLVERTHLARRPLGRAELRASRGGEGGAAELDFKLYRQATNKVAALSDAAAAFLDALF